LVDVDTQGQVSKALGIEPEHGLADLANGDATIEEVVVPARDNLSLVAGGRALAGLKRLITRKDFVGEQVLNETLSALDTSYDYVILDTAPGWDALTVNVLFYAQEVMAPVSLEVMTLQGLREFQKSMLAIQKYHPDLSLNYIVPTFFDRRVRKSAEILDQLHEHYGVQVCSPIRYNVRLSEAPGYGQTIFEYARHSPGADDYRALTERVMSHDRT
jgi:chromosome partitioning protein